jgi:hypothetical protein
VTLDCSKVIGLMNNGGNSFGPATAIYEEWSLLSRNFFKVIFSHCPREANVGAYVLATKAEGSQSVM